MILVYIRWRDACTEEAADPSSPVADDPLVELHEVGWLIGENDESVSIAMELEPSMRPGRWRLHIPKVNIVERRNFDTERLFKPARKRKA